MKFNYNGHQYAYNQYSNVLTDSTGLEVARFEPANVNNEYHYFIDIKSGEVMNACHENDPIGDINQVLAGQYEAFNE